MMNWTNRKEEVNDRKLREIRDKKEEIHDGTYSQMVFEMRLERLKE